MICPKCGHETSGNFCSNCGALLKKGGSPDARRITYDQSSGARRVKEWSVDREDPDRRQEGITGLNSPESGGARAEYNDNPAGLSNRTGYHRFSTGLYDNSQAHDSMESREERRENLRKREKYGNSTGKESRKKGSSPKASGKSGPGKKEARLEQKEKKLRDSRMRDLESEVERLTAQQRLRDRRRREDGEGGPESVTGPDLGEMAAKGAAGAVVLTARVMQIASCFLMGSMVFIMLRSFLAHGEGLGAVNTLAADRNYGLALYLGIAGFTLFMGGIWCLWILSKKGAGGGFRLKKYDTGRGLIPFLLCAAAVFAAGPLLTAIPPVTGVLEE